ncbi:MAG: hypothetical protein KC502_01165 [Myxococcales bacterium]|nr:hypothetical protein [Myxococcales bacterium]
MDPRPPTHDALDFNALWALGEKLMAAGSPVQPAQIDALAEEAGVPRAHAWMALSYAPMVQVQREFPVAIAVCGARCQLWGAEPLIADLLTLRDQRIGAGRVAFDLVPRGCLNRCQQAPVAVAALEDGIVGFPEATVAQVIELLDAIEADA